MGTDTAKGMRTPVRVFVVDDHPMIREGLTACIKMQPDMEVCGEAAEAKQALANISNSPHPDLVLVDIGLADGNGLDLIRQIKSRFPNIKTLVLSAFDESLYAERALRAGALGYVTKRECQEKIIDALRTVLGGGRYLSESMTQRLVSQAVLGKQDGTPTDPVQKLSNRELEVFRLIGQGQTSRAIANQLHLSVHTVDSHREKIRHKLNLKNSTELNREAVQWMLENS